MNFEICPLQDIHLADAEALFTEYPQTFNHDDKKILRQEFLEYLDHQRPDTYCFVACQNAKVVGAAMVHKDISSSNNYWEMDWLVVRKIHHNQGVGTALVKKVEEVVAKHGGEHLYLKTSEGKYNAETLKFYRKNGFAKLTQLPEYYGPKESADIFFKEVQPAR